LAWFFAGRVYGPPLPFGGPKTRKKTKQNKATKKELLPYQAISKMVICLDFS